MEKTKVESYVSNFDKNKRIINGLRKTPIIIRNFLNRDAEDYFEEHELNTKEKVKIMRQWEKGCRVKKLVTKTVNYKNIFGHNKSKEVEFFTDSTAYNCIPVFLGEIKNPYFMGDIEDYNGYIPEEACRLISKYKNIIGEEEEYSLVIIDVVPDRFDVHEKPTVDPMLGILYNNDFYMLTAWGGKHE